MFITEQFVLYIIFLSFDYHLMCSLYCMYVVGFKYPENGRPNARLIGRVRTVLQRMVALFTHPHLLAVSVLGPWATWRPYRMGPRSRPVGHLRGGTECCRLRRLLAVSSVLGSFLPPGWTTSKKGWLLTTNRRRMLSICVQIRVVIGHL